VIKFSASGFRDFTRIAASDPQMWHDICVANRDPLVQILTAYAAHLHQLTQAIQAGDGPQIKALFQRAKQTRDQING
jgi:prephenate dehydrogenase